MNRRNFFRGLLAATCAAVARCYVPAALVKAAAPASLPTGGVYYIVGVSRNTFQLATTPGGRPVILADGLITEAGSDWATHGFTVGEFVSM